MFKYVGVQYRALKSYPAEDTAIAMTRFVLLSTIKVYGCESTEMV